MSLAVQRLRLYASTVGGTGSIPGWRTKIQHVLQSVAKKEEKQKSSPQTERVNLMWRYCQH